MTARRQGTSRGRRGSTFVARVTGVLRRRARRIRGTVAAAVRGVRAPVRFARQWRLNRRPRLARHWRRAAAALAVAVVIAGVLSERGPITRWVLAHPYFAVDEILVSPTQPVREGALLQWMRLQPGVSIWTLEPRALERRLEEHPWIRRARVRREFPRRLTVDVSERRAAAILLIDQLYYVDGTGVVFAPVGAADPLELPFVTGIEAAVLNGERPYPRHAVRQALKLVQLLRDSGLPFRVSEVHIERDEGITVFPVEPQVALEFGWGRFSTKLARLGEVLAAFVGREGQLREIDLTYDTEVVIRLRQGTGGGRRARV